jgi:NAD(P) transhydrogenase subunit alpha
MGEDFYHRQRELMARVVKDCQVVITTAAIPGKKAPVLITREMVESMAPGSVVVDLAAERGGNCEATEAGQSVDVNGVQVLGPVNLPSTLPYHSSQMYSKNIATFLLHLFTKEGQMNINLEDEIIRETLVAKDGKVVNERVRQLLETPGKE